MHKRAWIVCAVMLLSEAVSPRGEYVVFGPETFQRQSGSTPYSRTFTVLEVTGRYGLRVRNGGPNDEFRRATSTSIRVDGVLVVKPGDLNPTVREIDKPVTLLPPSSQDPRHTLTLEVQGPPGSAISVSIY